MPVRPHFSRRAPRQVLSAPIQVQFFVLERNGYAEEVYITCSYSPVPGDSGGVGKWGGTNTGMDDRKRADEALRESEARVAADLAGMKRLQDMSTRLVHDGSSARLLEEIVDAAIEITAAMGNIQLLDPDGASAAGGP
jgi:hypothetical protein